MADTELEQQAEVTETQQTEQAQQPGQSLSLQDLIVLRRLSNYHQLAELSEQKNYNKLVHFIINWLRS